MITADLHVHTKYSKDSKMEPRLILKIAKTRGIDCIAITDHNTIRGSVLTKKIKSDVRVIIGSEIKTNKGEVVGYNLNENIRPGNIYDVIDKIKSQGGILSIPHPFDCIRSGIADDKLLKKILNKIDFLELNARTLWFFNKKAEYFAKKHKIPLIAGSDAHMEFEIGKFLTVLKDRKIVPIRTITKNTSKIYPLYPLVRTKIYKILKI